MLCADKPPLKNPFQCSLNLTLTLQELIKNARLSVIKSERFLVKFIYAEVAMHTLISSTLVVVAASYIALWINDRFPLGGYINDEQ